jgi:hypothetical protein
MVGRAIYWDEGVDQEREGQFEESIFRFSSSKVGECASGVVGYAQCANFSAGYIAVVSIRLKL